MPDPDSSPPERTAKPVGRYPIASAPATPSLAALLHDRIAAEGPLPFPDFMAAALYHPELGYYAAEPRQVGRGGDFFTSVSVGPLFGRLLARRFVKEWQVLGRPARWRLLECGAHDGTLAADVLGALRGLSPAAFEALEYAIAEPLPRPRAAQQATLAPFAGKVAWHDSPAGLADTPLPGIAFGNELLDALPFHLVEWRDGDWHACRVAAADGKFAWETAEVADPALRRALAPLGQAFPDGYRTEVRTGLGDFLQAVMAAVSPGLMVWPDYGFARPEYYLPERRAGTLRTFSRHRAGSDPLENPGGIDITAHVDFTAVAEAALALGARPAEFRPQGPWLTELARSWLTGLESHPDPAALRQFQTLTHPGHLGGNFHVLELVWGRPCETPPEVVHRLALPPASFSSPAPESGPSSDA